MGQRDSIYFVTETFNVVNIWCKLKQGAVFKMSTSFCSKLRYKTDMDKSWSGNIRRRKYVFSDLS